MKKKLNVVAIAGPTASGKTKLSIEYAKNHNGEIISADSRLVYKGFDIATAKPTIEERQGIPHYLIDIVEPDFDYSVANFYDDAKSAIEEISSKGKKPIIVGGTGLYFRILLENYAPPRIKADENLRNELNQLSNEELSNKLKNLDFDAYEKIYTNDRVRLIRALEVTILSGVPFSKQAGVKREEYNVTWITPKIESRDELNNRINKRVDEMVEKGLLEETESLLNKYGRIKNITNTIGYQEMIEFLDNKISFDEAIEKIKLNSRHYAKRQLTWFRRNKNLEINY